MSTQKDEPQIETVAKTEPALEELMGVSASDAAAARAQVVDRPRSAARVGATPEPAAPERNPWVLRALLLINLAMMGVVLALPIGKAPAPDHTGEQPAPKVDDPFLKPPRQLGGLPTSKYWDEALQSAGKGDLSNAIMLLERYLELSPDMTDVERRLVYNQIAYYLAKDGRTEAALDYERRSSQLMSRSHLPDDLLQSAHRAEQEGKLPAMRSAYARFLLQQKQIPPSLRRHIAEAYLKLGESYRLEAEAGERKSGGGKQEPADESTDAEAGAPAKQQPPGHGPVPPKKEGDH